MVDTLNARPLKMSASQFHLAQPCGQETKNLNACVGLKDLTISLINQVYLGGRIVPISLGARWGPRTMDILTVLGTLFLLFLVTAWSCVRSYFDRGRLKGMEEATREIIRGISSHYELEGRVVPKKVADAVEAVKVASIATARSRKASPFHAHLWVFGDAVGEACWRRGYKAGSREMAPSKGVIRLDLSLGQLLQLSWLAHLGFQHMMPNYRGFEMHRFSGEDDAREGAHAVDRLESAIPTQHRSSGDFTAQSINRQGLIRDWWQNVPKRLTA